MSAKISFHSLLCVVVFASQFVCCLANAEDIETPKELNENVSAYQDDSELSTALDDDAYSSLFDTVEKYFIQLLAALVAVAMTAIIAFVNQQKGGLKERLASLNEKLSGLTKPARLGPDETTNSVMILGLGGVGKTSLIRAVTKDNKADPQVATNDYAIYSTAQNIPAEGPKKRCVIYMSDYVGQNLGSLVRSFIEQQRIEYSPMRYGYIDSLVLVVDLVPPPLLADIDTAKVENYEKKRIKENIEQWSEQTISAVFGMLTASLKYVCLYINKIDTIEISGSELEEDIRKQFEPLRTLLSARSRGAKFETIVGSAKNGMGVQTLHDSLIKYSAESRN